ncbi:histidine phosphatase family protein [Sandaracinus amylolyticus]|uniref:Alpha-ribazole-5'-phosphate phosphatase n=1 Tax=Sandaracinus amylolyticus TaxID=927083 RepID=A0A0F6YLY2_9BACT|nr:histidine phosphatase family protein [Sandaracinus amylolyticus]AKF08801.1 Alpha-ribazole-5'-phosphate phosphatase [Sandaracinus amylolyticus]
MTSLVVIRHAPTHASGRCIGRTEVDVELAHVDAARVIVERIAGHGVHAVWSSPLSRCAVPASIVARTLGVPHRVDTRLLEIDHGSFDGRAWDEIDPGALERWMRAWEHEGAPGGESARDVEARVRAWWDELEHDALLVAHAGVARALRVIVDGTAWTDAMSLAITHLAVDAVHRRR